jgi:hypothetical protein
MRKNLYLSPPCEGAPKTASAVCVRGVLKTVDINLTFHTPLAVLWLRYNMSSYPSQEGNQMQM